MNFKEMLKTKIQDGGMNGLMCVCPLYLYSFILI